MRQRSLLLLLAGLVLVACPTSDDDDATGDDDDSGAADDDDACGEPSNGSGLPTGTSWHEVPGFGTPADEVPDYELLLHVPVDLDPTVAAPVLMLVGRRMPLNRPENEEIIFEWLAMDDLATDNGWVLAIPMAGTAGDGRLSWTESATDDAYFDAWLDLLAAGWNIDLDRVHMVGSSAGGAAAVFLGYEHAERVASLVDHAGSNPYFGQWPSTPWPAECAALFVHDEADPVVGREGVEDAALMFEEAGQHVERAYEYDSGHDWNPDELGPLMADFFGRMCNEGGDR
jgi:hypothetical protein